MNKDKIIDGCLWPAGSLNPLDAIQEVGTKFTYASPCGISILFTVEEVTYPGKLTLKGSDGEEYSTSIYDLTEDWIKLEKEEGEEDE